MKKTLIILIAILSTTAITFSTKADDNDKIKKESNTFTFTDENFNANIKEGVVLIDFWAVWCGPCRRQAPIIEDVANVYKNEAIIGKLNVDQNKNISSQFQIRSIPTIIIFKDGTPVERLVGLQSAEKIVSLIEKHL